MLQQRDLKELSSGYSRTFRMVEIMASAAFFAMSFWLLFRVARGASQSFGWAAILASVAVAYVLADFVSGVVHWAADTWGSPDWPIIGTTLIRPFREHHVDPVKMTTHDFFESSGAHCLVSLPVLIAASYLDPMGSLGSLAGVTGATTFVLFILFTAQTHKWAHLQDLPAWIRALQSCRLVLTIEHHAGHHTAPFAQNYCITTGWLNPILNRTGFFRKLERVITALTGALPRKDDIGEAAARVYQS